MRRQPRATARMRCLASRESQMPGRWPETGAPSLSYSPQAAGPGLVEPHTTQAAECTAQPGPRAMDRSKGQAVTRGRESTRRQEEDGESPSRDT